MSYRFMRVIVMFDLPTLTKDNMRDHRRFRKFLLKNGFIMLQESIYTKLTLNSTNAKLVQDNVRKNKPCDGVVSMLTITEKQYNDMEFLVGSKKSSVIDSDERLVIL